MDDERGTIVFFIKEAILLVLDFYEKWKKSDESKGGNIIAYFEAWKPIISYLGYFKDIHNFCEEYRDTYNSYIFEDISNIDVFKNNWEKYYKNKVAIKVSDLKAREEKLYLDKKDILRKKIKSSSTGNSILADIDFTITSAETANSAMHEFIKNADLIDSYLSIESHKNKNDWEESLVTQINRALSHSDAVLLELIEVLEKLYSLVFKK